MEEGRMSKDFADWQANQDPNWRPNTTPAGTDMPKQDPEADTPATPRRTTGVSKNDTELDDLLTEFLVFSMGNKVIASSPEFARANAKTALEAWRDRAIREARIGELEYLVALQVDVGKLIPLKTVIERLTELRALTDLGAAGDGDSAPSVTPTARAGQVGTPGEAAP